MHADYVTLAYTCRPKRALLGLVGADGSGGYGDIFSTIFSAAGEMTKRGIENVQSQEAKEQTQKTSAADLATAITADQAATDARARALTSAAGKLPSADADQKAADLSDQAQDVAGAGLSSDNQRKRAEAAKEALKQATSAWQKEPKSATKRYRVEAAQRTLVKAQAGQITAAVGPGSTPALPQSPASSWQARGIGAGIGAALGLALGLALADSKITGAALGLLVGGGLGLGGAIAKEKLL